MTRTRTNGNGFSNSVVTGTEGKSATLKSLCSSVYQVDTKTYPPSDIRWLSIQVRLNCYIICKTLPSEKKREIVLYLIMLMHAHTHPFILFVRKDVRSTDVFPVVASLPIFRRERSDECWPSFLIKLVIANNMSDSVSKNVPWCNSSSRSAYEEERLKLVFCIFCCSHARSLQLSQFHS